MLISFHDVEWSAICSKLSWGVIRKQHLQGGSKNNDPPIVSEYEYCLAFPEVFLTKCDKNFISFCVSDPSHLQQKTITPNIIMWCFSFAESSSKKPSSLCNNFRGRAWQQQKEPSTFFFMYRKCVQPFAEWNLPSSIKSTLAPMCEDHPKAVDLAEIQTVDWLQGTAEKLQAWFT